MINIEKEIAEKIVKANSSSTTKLGLRFDRVVVRLLGNLRFFVEQANANQKIILMTISAPIKLATKTEKELKSKIKDLLNRKDHDQDLSFSIFQNEVRLRIMEFQLNKSHKFVGLVHNPRTDPELLLDFATRWLHVAYQN